VTRKKKKKKKKKKKRTEQNRTRKMPTTNIEFKEEVDNKNTSNNLNQSRVNRHTC
jgi:hypothetical protein